MGRTWSFLTGYIKKQETVKKKKSIQQLCGEEKRLKRKHEKAIARLLEEWPWRGKKMDSRGYKRRIKS